MTEHIAAIIVAAITGLLAGLIPSVLVYFASVRQNRTEHRRQQADQPKAYAEAADSIAKAADVSIDYLVARLEANRCKAEQLETGMQRLGQELATVQDENEVLRRAMRRMQTRVSRLTRENAELREANEALAERLKCICRELVNGSGKNLCPDCPVRVTGQCEGSERRASAAEDNSPDRARGNLE